MGAEHSQDAAVSSELRLPGLTCPMPVLKAKKALAKMVSGDRLAVWSTDKHSAPDLADFCRQTGNDLLEQFERDEDNHHWFVSVISRKAE